MQELPSSGSNRRYFRLRSASCSLMGVVGNNLEENRAFLYLSRHFREKGLPVPAVVAVSEDQMTYLQEDLGTTGLFELVAPGREKGSYNEEETRLLCQALEELPRLQFAGAEGLDWQQCMYEAFNARMVDFDLNYFKYCFLKATGLEFNEERLQDDFERLKANLLLEESNTFMHRDFQARNIMVKDGKPWIIDFQGGRRGPIYYDVASFVWQARSRFPEATQKRLLEAYLNALRPFQEVDQDHFYSRLRLFVLFRTLQVLGAYGFRGLFERKAQFISSIPPAMDNLRGLLKKPFTDYPYLNSLLEQIVALPRFQNKAPEEPGKLLVHIYSFSLKKGVPEDLTGNGGGYVFDCRAIHNPGKYERYRNSTGMDADVIQFLEEDGEVTTFLESVYKLVDAHVRRFQERGFTHLQVSFGCTGGQHRSVYCAEHLAAHLAAKFDLKIVVTHRERKIEKTL
ncbi:MAG: RNase adapter RapZ [Candidatus Cryptobacteroides sp.]|nr:RNase adapter RapZ [Candidatus Cryptobacteroides sp.]